MPGEIRRVAEFLDIEVEESIWPTIVEHCTFDYMKKNGDKLSPILGDAFVGGGGSFINKGTNGRWREMLSAADIEKYERAAGENLTPDCAHWLATGEMVD
jgi:aryl sulfotransferase